MSRHAAPVVVPEVTPVETPETGRSGQIWFWTVAIIVLAVSPWLYQVRPLENLVVLTLFIVVCATGIARSVAGTFRPMLCFFSSFNLCWLAIPVTYQLTHHRAAWNDYGVFDDDGRTFVALLVLTVGTGAMLLGYESARNRDGQKERGTRVAPRPLDVRRSVRWSIGALVASVLVLPLVARSVGGLAGLFRSRYDVASALSANGFDYSDTGGGLFALVRIVPGVLALVALLLALGVIRDARENGRKVALELWIVVAAGTVMITIYLNPIANPRYNFATAVGAVVLVWFRPRAQAVGRLVAVGTIVGLLVIYPLGNVFRYGFNTTLSETAVSTGLEALYSPDFDGAQQAVNSVALVEAHGHTDGMEVASAALIFIPRSVWPSKAVPTNVLVAENRGYAFTNLSIPVQAELYVDLGFLGLILLMGLWGRAAAWIDSVWRRVGAGVPLVAFLCVAQIGLIRGPLSGAGGFTGLGLVLLWLALRTRPAK